MEKYVANIRDMWFGVVNKTDTTSSETNGQASFTAEVEHAIRQRQLQPPKKTSQSYKKQTGYQELTGEDACCCMQHRRTFPDTN